MSIVTKELCACGKRWNEENPDCVFNYHKKSTTDAILCLLCMEDYKKEYCIKEIGISLFFCEKHYPKEWDTIEKKGETI